VVGVLEGPGFESGRSKRLLSSPKRPHGPCNPPSRRRCKVIEGPEHEVDHSPNLAPRFLMSAVTLLLHLYAFMARTLRFHFLTLIEEKSANRVPESLKEPLKHAATLLRPELLHVAPNQFTAGRNGAVGIATRYGLDGPEIESRWDRVFPHPSTPVLGPNQPPIKWIPGLSLWGGGG
jgi:hypothetical protein